MLSDYITVGQSFVTLTNGFFMRTNFEAFVDYLSLQKKYSPHTVLAYSDDLREFTDFVQKEYEQDNIDEVNYPQIRSWIVSLSEAGLTNRTINRKVSSLKAYYKFLLRIKQISENPLLTHKSLKTTKKIQVPFSESEVNSLVDEEFFDSGFEGLRDKLIIEMFYMTGMRRAELIGLKISDVSFSANTLKVLGKRNKERMLPLLPEIVEKIKVYLDLRNTIESKTDDDYLFLTKKGVKLNNTFVYRLINSYFSRVSVKTKKSPHMLRHSFATHLLNNGADINSVKELLGHSSLASTQVYTHSGLAELKKAYIDAHPRNNR